MKKKLLCALTLLAIVSLFSVSALAAETYTVVAGDSLWKIAVRYEVGLSELKAANPQIVNPSLIYPGQVITVPTKDQAASAYEKEVVRLVNEIRVQNGLKPLTYDWQLARVARYKSQDMKDNRYFAHTSPVYGTPAQMIKSFGISYRSMGENIARGQQTPKQVVDGWMNSLGHRANILSRSFTHIGVGYVAEGKYWTQMFIGR